jgi:hypothetical protein
MCEGMENSLKQQTGSCPLKTFDEDKATGSSGRGVSNKRGSFLSPPLLLFRKG